MRFLPNQRVEFCQIKASMFLLFLWNKGNLKDEFSKCVCVRFKMTVYFKVTWIKTKYRHFYHLPTNLSVSYFDRLCYLREPKITHNKNNLWYTTSFHFPCISSTHLGTNVTSVYGQSMATPSPHQPSVSQAPGQGAINAQQQQMATAQQAQAAVAQQQVQQQGCISKFKS